MTRVLIAAVVVWFATESHSLAALASSKLTATSTTTDGTSVTSPTITPTANALVLLLLVAHDDSNAPETVLSFSGTNWANGVTWTLVESVDVVNGDDGGTAKVMVYSTTAPSSVTGGTVTANFTSTHENFHVYVVEWTDTATPEVVQAKSGTAGGSLTHEISFDSSPSASNGVAVLGAISENATWAGGTGLTDYGIRVTATGTPQWSSGGGYATTGQDTLSMNSNGADNSGLVAMEIGEPSASAAINPISSSIPGSSLDPIRTTIP